jgi:O-acetyl-ADP-ribose deacetylase (regulator of RNase III)
MLGLRRYRGIQIDLWQGDITSFAVDAIVNAANESLTGGMGVDGAIHSVGGPEILSECRKIGSCETGSVVVTSAGKLPAKWVIHAVGPVWSNGHLKAAELLEKCYLNIFKQATVLAARHISIPAISTGAYHYPPMEAAEIAFKTLKKYLDADGAKSSFPGRLTFVAFDGKMYDILQSKLFSEFEDELGDEGY